MRNEKVLVRKYLDALVASLKENECQELLNKLKDIINFIINDNELWHLFRTPFLNVNEKSKLIEIILIKYTNDKRIERFFSLLILKKRLILLPDFIIALEKEIIKASKYHKAEIFTNYAIDKKTETRLVDFIENKLSLKLIPTFNKTPEIIGGFKAIIGNMILDGSLKNSFQSFHDKILKTNYMN